MATCWACEAPLDPAWKFCIRCGVSVAAGQAMFGSSDSAPAARSREPVTAYALFGWILAGLGAAILITGAVLFIVTQ